MTSYRLEVPSNPKGALDTRKLARAKAQQHKRQRRKDEETIRKAQKAEYDRQYRARYNSMHKFM